MDITYTATNIINVAGKTYTVVMLSSFDTKDYIKADWTTVTELKRN